MSLQKKPTMLILVYTAFYLHVMSRLQVEFGLVFQVAYELGRDKSSPHMVVGGVGGGGGMYIFPKRPLDPIIYSNT